MGRNNVVKNLWHRSNAMDLNLECRYPGVYLLDHFMAEKNIPLKQFDLYSAAALLIGAKLIQINEIFWSNFINFHKKKYFLQ